MVGAALALPVAPLAAEPVDPESQDLRCAAFAAFVVGTEQTPEVQSAFSMALTWFLGRYEGTTGQPFEQALTPAYLSGLEGSIAQLQAECVPLMEGLSARLSSLGEDLTATPAADGEGAS